MCCFSEVEENIVKQNDQVDHVQDSQDEHPQKSTYDTQQKKVQKVDQESGSKFEQKDPQVPWGLPLPWDDKKNKCKKIHNDGKDTKKDKSETNALDLCFED